MSSVHTISTDAPLALVPYVTVLADCGKIVEHPVIACMWDETEMGEMLTFPRSVCRKCVDASDMKHVRYVYAIRRGQTEEATEPA
jgi:hypothetical protein